MNNVFFYSPPHILRKLYSRKINPQKSKIPNPNIARNNNKFKQ